MQKLFLALSLFTLLAACGPQQPELPPAATSEESTDSGADLIIINARVYSLNWPASAPAGTLSPQAPYSEATGWQPDAEAVVVNGDRIVFVGSSAAAVEYQGANTNLVDAQDATVVPGLVDSHTHIFNLGASLSRVSLYGVETEEEAVARIVEKAKEVPPGEWIVGQGWDEGAWANRYPDMTLLTEAVPDHPVYMRSLHSFAGWGNRMAFARAGITADTEVPSGGEIRTFENGEPNGLLLNRAVPLLEGAVPPPDREALTEQVLSALQQMALDGYVTVHDAGLGAEEMAILETLEAAGRLPIRVYAMLSARDELLSRAWLARGPDTDSDSFLVTRSVKAYYDGALGSRGARMLEDYTDMPGHRGVSGSEYGFDQTLVAEMMQRGFQVGIHAIGDAGNMETLDFISRVADMDPESVKLRHRIEHAQVIHPDDIERFAALQLVASMEPPHAVEDKTWAEDRVGPQRILGAYAWRTLREAGVTLTFNADNPGSDHREAGIRSRT
jgi:predicted amidohydrolase YtcJ